MSNLQVVKCYVAWDFSESGEMELLCLPVLFLFCRRRRHHRLVCGTVRHRVIQLHHRWQLQSV